MCVLLLDCLVLTQLRDRIFFFLYCGAQSLFVQEIKQWVTQYPSLNEGLY
jgi:hypothetical protein